MRYIIRHRKVRPFLPQSLNIQPHPAGLVILLLRKANGRYPITNIANQRPFSPQSPINQPHPVGLEISLLGRPNGRSLPIFHHPTQSVSTFCYSGSQTVVFLLFGFVVFNHSLQRVRLAGELGTY